MAHLDEPERWNGACIRVVSPSCPARSRPYICDRFCRAPALSSSLASGSRWSGAAQEQSLSSALRRGRGSEQSTDDATRRDLTSVPASLACADRPRSQRASLNSADEGTKQFGAALRAAPHGLTKAERAYVSKHRVDEIETRLQIVRCIAQFNGAVVMAQRERGLNRKLVRHFGVELRVRKC